MFGIKRGRGPCNSAKCNCPDCSLSRAERGAEIRSVVKDEIGYGHVTDIYIKRKIDSHLRGCETRLDNRVRGIIAAERAEFMARKNTAAALGRVSPIRPDKLAVYPWRYPTASRTYEWVRFPSGDWQRRNNETGKLFGDVVPSDKWRNLPDVLGKPYIVDLPADTVKATADIDSHTVGCVSKTEAKITVEGNPTAAGEFMRAAFEEVPDFLPPKFASGGYVTGRWDGKRYTAKLSDVVKQSRLPHGFGASIAEMEEARERANIMVAEFRITHPEVCAVWTDTKETTSMTLFEIAMLAEMALHRPVVCDSVTSRGARQSLVNLGLIRALEIKERGAVPPAGYGYEITPKGGVYLDALVNMPLPVQQEAPWVMPAPGVRGAS